MNHEGMINTRLEIMGDERRLTPEVELTLFRIAQEALQNVRRHSAATEAAIRLKLTAGKVRLIIYDNGRGCDFPERLGDFAVSAKLGLIGMQERTRLLNGTFSVKSQVGRGTTLLIEAADLESSTQS